ncbi:bifunctional transcriptional activator/DNA repair enzyme AdaA [Pseudooceanicola onchidii]|uniref:bifunctional transcriptional activator/DNA repair enzyme AdaA n=1 Tax=Pseudooceanicola onchidii TaxID=2562279 RepID=UPI0010AA0CC4|nr:trifunctional transcriptional activator/DNA repair protein Ada/methylated-DNA--[protein]-cysteine S-methyltransferase [Pseudooceanicola onchidii]
MMFDLPDPATCYASFFDSPDMMRGRLWVGVTSTGILCRPGCPARRPKPENCAWFASVPAALDAGFRPCKRCRPTEPAGADPLVARLSRALEDDPARRWSEGDVSAMGIDPSTARRAFRRALGITFLDYARLRRLQAGARELSRGSRVIDAQLEAGFDSGSGFRAAFARLLGLPPEALATRADALLQADWIDTELGPMIAVADDHGLHLLEFADRPALPRELARLHKAVKGRMTFGRTAPMDQAARELARYLAGDDATFSTPLTYHGTPFTCAVWDALRQIPAGETLSYSALAARLGRPEATRAVARANGANQIAVLIPCHRVVGADGSLTGYGGGLWRKDRLIELERSYGRATA